MISLLYFVVAVVILALAIQAFIADRDDPARQAFLAFAAAVAIAYAAFALSLLPTLGAIRPLYQLAGGLAPAAMLWTVERSLTRDASPPTPSMRAVYVGSVMVAPLGALLTVALTEPLTRGAAIPALTGTFAGWAFMVALRRLWDAQTRHTLRVDRTRLRYLFIVAAAAVGFTVIEQVGRVIGSGVDPATLSLSTRAVALQGPIPPFSAVFTLVSFYFLYHSVVMSRLLDLSEVLARMSTLLLSAGALVLIDGLTFLWVDTFTVYPFHGTFQIFLASLLFLAAYDPLRHQIAAQVNRALNRRERQLLDVCDELVAQMPRIITADRLTEVLVEGLHRSGRAPWCSVYLWDSRVDAFVCQAERHAGDREPLHRIAEAPFADRLARGGPWYTRAAVERRAQHDPQQAEVLGLMDAMNADLTMPFVSGRTVLGWVQLRDEAWSEGYSAEEILALQDVAGRAATVLLNARSIEAIEEQKRLAALGAMSAGLAHEIRNPLAGLKGAAQVLQHESLPDDSQEMLQVIVDECERLDRVVSQFLDYARPFQLHLADTSINALIAHATTLLRSQGLPDGVSIAESLASDLPNITVDPTRITQVLLNLGQNAIQAMPSGGTLTFSTERRVDRRDHTASIEIRVRDTGIGMDEATVDQLYVPFFTTKTHGTGLGLAISQRLVLAHGGDIEVLTAPLRGTTFVIRIPLPPAEGR